MVAWVRFPPSSPLKLEYNKSMKTFNNLKELCVDGGYDNFYQFGRSLYKFSYGLWTRLILDDGSEVYYEDKSANTIPDNAVALEIGSIVEGSEVEIDAVRLTFPFTDKELWETVESVNEEANFYWKRDNEDDYQVEYDGKFYYICGEEFPEDMSENVKTFFDESYDEICELDDGDSLEKDGFKVTKIDKSDFIF